MEVTFWGVRGSIPAPGPGTVGIGGNTSCVSVRTASGALIILDCGTGARNLGLTLLGQGFAEGNREAAILLSHTHWDHIQGFPFFGPLYIVGNVFRVYGPAQSSGMLEGILEGQMAPQFFPVQTLKNMGARIEIAAVTPGAAFDVFGCTVTAVLNPHGRASALAFRIEDRGRVLVYASDAGYPEGGPSPEALALYQGADLLIHDSTYTPEDRVRYLNRGLASVNDAVDAATRAGVRRLALFHYDQDYTDHDVEVMLGRARAAIESSGAKVDVLAASEGMAIRL